MIMWFIARHTVTRLFFSTYFCLLNYLSYTMKFFILLLSIITIIVAAPPPPPPPPPAAAASQYDARAVGAMPCYLGCCKFFPPDRSNFLWTHIYFFIYFIMCIRVSTLGTPCERINCLNGGYCIQPATPTTLAYCHCPAQYTGYRCEQSGKKEKWILIMIINWE